MLAKQLPARYTFLFERRRTHGEPMSQLEKETFGWTHAQAGALLARRWNIPDNCGFVD